MNTLKRIRRILLFASLATLSYFLLGLIINRIAPERLPGPETHLAVGTVMESRQEGFRQVITRMEAGRIWTRLVLLPGALGPPEHVHTGFAEVFQVVEGTLSILYNGKVEMLKRTAVLDLCPCRVRTEIPVVWDRLIEMPQVFGTARPAVTYRPNRSRS